MHLDDLLGDGEAKARAALGLGHGAVDLMELISYAGLLLHGDPRSRVRHADGEVTVDRLRRDAHLARVGEFDGITDEVKQHLGEALFVPEANWKRLVHRRRERELLVL